MEGARHQFAPYLAHALTSKTITLIGLGRRDDARSTLEKSLGLLEDLVLRQGRKELSQRLASAWRLRAALRSSGPSA